MFVECLPFWPFLPEFQTRDEWEAAKANSGPSIIEVSYDDYLRSPHWIMTRAEALERDGHRCRLCSSTEKLQVHHSTYENLWDEDPLDLITLCDHCHAHVPRATGR